MSINRSASPCKLENLHLPPLAATLFSSFNQHVFFLLFPTAARRELGSSPMALVLPPSAVHGELPARRRAPSSLGVHPSFPSLHPPRRSTPSRPLPHFISSLCSLGRWPWPDRPLARARSSSSPMAAPPPAAQRPPPPAASPCRCPTAAHPHPLSLFLPRPSSQPVFFPNAGIHGCTAPTPMAP